MEEKYNSEEEQKLDNQVKKLKIELETGAKFFSPAENKLSVDLETQFLDNILAFEDASKNKIIKTIGEILGNPVLVPIDELTDEQINECLRVFFQLMKEHNLELDFIYETPDREVYKFISEDFLAIRDDVVQLPGMTAHFVYEEFVPNDDADLRSNAEDILACVFNGDYNFLQEFLAEEVYLDSFKIDQEEYIERLVGRLCETTLELILFEITNSEISTSEGRAVVEGNISYFKTVFDGAPETISEQFKVGFTTEYDLWVAERVSIPSLE